MSTRDPPVRKVGGMIVLIQELLPYLMILYGGAILLALLA